MIFTTKIRERKKTDKLCVYVLCISLEVDGITSGEEAKKTKQQRVNSFLYNHGI